MSTQVCSSCDKCQAYCEINQTAHSDFKFTSSLESGKPLITQAEWREAIAAINNVVGDSHKIGTGFNYNYLTAADFKEVISTVYVDLNLPQLGITALTNDNLEEKVSPGKPIYGTYFQDLQIAITNIKYRTDQVCSGNMSSTYECSDDTE